MRTIPIDEELREALELCGFVSGERQESRLMSILVIILRLQDFPPIPLTFTEIYEQFQKEKPSTKLTKAWVHRVLKSLVDTQLIRVENPKSHRKRYIADINTIVTGFERLKNIKVEDLETRKKEIDEDLTRINALDCGNLSNRFIKAVTGRQEEVSSRIVRGVEELHRVLRYNMVDNAGEGDIIRATTLWIGPFADDEIWTRTMRFAEAAEKGADVRYLVSTKVFDIEVERAIPVNLEEIFRNLKILGALKAKGIKFDIRIYLGPNTYNQISFNKENMALVITENPMTATWLTRRFNPDLIDNAVKTFDKDWKSAKSIFDLTADATSFFDVPEKELEAFGDAAEGLIRLVMSHNNKGKPKDSSE